MTAESIYARLVSEESKRSPSKSPSSGRSTTRGEPTGDSGHGEISRAAGGIDHHLEPDDLRGKSIREKEYPTLEERKRLRIGLTREMEGKLHGTVAGLMDAEIKKATHAEIPGGFYFLAFLPVCAKMISA